MCVLACRHTHARSSLPVEYLCMHVLPRLENPPRETYLLCKGDERRWRDGDQVRSAPHQQATSRWRWRTRLQHFHIVPNPPTPFSQLRECGCKSAGMCTTAYALLHALQSVCTFICQTQKGCECVCVRLLASVREDAVKCMLCCVCVCALEDCVTSS